MRPRIGISVDEELRPVRQVPIRHPFLQHTYIDAVLAAGGLPVLLPNVPPEHAKDYAEHLDGIVLSGGDFDVDPAMFGEAPHEKLGTLKPHRTQFELALLKIAEERNLPVLGVCGGMQLMNVARGGTLFQDLPSQQPGPVAHTMVGDRREPGHSVTVVPGGLLSKLVGDAPLGVNSTHHQAIKSLGRDLDAEALAEDGIVEAFSDGRRRFYLAVQWHPEALRDQTRQAEIYKALIAAAA